VGTRLPDARDNGVGFELVLSFCGLDDKLASLVGDNGVFVDILGKNVIIVIGDVIGRDVDAGGDGGCGSSRRLVCSRGRVFTGGRRHTIYYWDAGMALIICLGGSRCVLVAGVGVVRRGKRVGCTHTHTVSDHGTALRRHVRKQNVLGDIQNVLTSLYKMTTIKDVGVGVSRRCEDASAAELMVAGRGWGGCSRRGCGVCE
jgi:hypothetical protein